MHTPWFPARRRLHTVLWIVQMLLAGALATSGLAKVALPMPALVTALGWPGSLPEWLVRAIGVFELAAAGGLILPALTRIRPRLTTMAAIGVMVLMVLAIGLHVARGEIEVIWVHLLLASGAGFVVWGRERAAITPRGQKRLRADERNRLVDRSAAVRLGHLR